jgi:hypothetical protein
VNNSTVSSQAQNLEYIVVTWIIQPHHYLAYLVHKTDFQAVQFIRKNRRLKGSKKTPSVLENTRTSSVIQTNNLEHLDQTVDILPLPLVLTFVRSYFFQVGEEDKKMASDIENFLSVRIFQSIAD